GAVPAQEPPIPYYGIEGKIFLRKGPAPHTIIETLIASDAGHASRQLHIMDAGGRTAAYTGKDCVDWCGHLAGDGFSIAGNMLAGGKVLDDTATAYSANTGTPFA